MKKIILTLVIILTMTLAVSQAKATCPIGYTPYTVNFIDNGCNVFVEYCVYYDPISIEYDILISDINIIPACDPHDLTFWTTIIDAIMQDIINNNVIYPCESLHDKTKIKITKAGCYYYQNGLSPIAPGYILSMISCDYSGLCKITYEVCIDTNTEPYSIRKTLLYIEYIKGLINCIEESPALPPPGKTWFEPWTTGCYTQPCAAE